MSEVTTATPVESGDSGAPRTANRKRILLVEGDGFTRLVLLLRLRLAGFGVDFTSNGILGLGKLRSCNPDVLLVELKLCGLSGLELIKAARAEPSFGDRPIYVFTHAARMNRATRKEVAQVATKIFDKTSTSREDLVQTFVTTFCNQQPAREKVLPDSATKMPPASVETPAEVVLPQAIEEIVAGVREESELLARDGADRSAIGEELLSRVCSLSSCADVAGLPNLARQAKALEKFLSQLCLKAEDYKAADLSTITRAVAVMSAMSFDRTAQEQTLKRYSAVLIDEAPSSNRAMEQNLRDAGFEPVCFEEPARARAYLASNHTELIVANMVLPEAHSLSLADIRQLPLHAETPVLFGPDSSVTAPLGERLPTIAARLDNEPVLRTGLVVMALNEVQGSTHPPTPQESVEEPAQPTEFAGTRRSTAVSPAFDDGFELFARAGSVASAPLLRTHPSTPPADSEVEMAARLPATTTDNSQIDDQPLETLEASVLQAEPPPPPQPEAAVEDQAAAAAWLAEAAGEVSPPISSIDQNQAAEGPDGIAATPQYEEEMNTQVEADPARYQQQAPATPTDNGAEEQQSQREDLVARVCAAEMEMYRAQRQVEEKDEQIQTLRQELAKMTGGQQPGDDKAAEQKAQARCVELEQELAALRQAFEDFSGSFGQQQQAAAETSKYVEELEQRLSQTTAEQAQQREQQKLAAEQAAHQLEAADQAKQQSEAARQEAEARCAQLQQELGNLHQNHGDLANKLVQEQKANTEAAARLKELETRLSTGEPGPKDNDAELQVRQGVAALARATADLAKERGERQRSEQRTAELNERLQALHQDLSRTLHAQRQDLARISALEEQQRQVSEALDRRTADVEQLQAERQLAQEQLQKTKEMNAQLRKDLSFFDETNKKFGGARQELHAQLEASLKAAREHEAMLQQKSDEHHRLAASLEETKQDLQNQSRRRETLEQELKSAQAALHSREEQLQKEAAERQRLKEALDSAQRTLRGGPERDLELSKLQSALHQEQVERKRQEVQLARMRQSALDSAHAARSLRAGLRRQIREPVDNLVHSSRALLELETNDDQKKLAEAMLQDVLLVQTRLREPEPPQSDPAEPSAAHTTAGA